MKTFYWILAIIILGILGYYAFYLGWALLKIFIGLLFIAIFAFGFWLGRITKKSNKSDYNGVDRPYNI